MIERWARPVIPLGVEEAGKSLRVGNRRYDIPTFILDEEGVERVRLGYVCIACLEQHEVPYPRFCSHCVFPMRALQDEVFLKTYEGEVKVGPRTSLDEEWEIAKEEVQRANRSDA